MNPPTDSAQELSERMQKLSTGQNGEGEGATRKRVDRLLPEDDTNTRIKVKTSNQQELPSIYVAVKRFEDLNLKPELLRAVYSMGWNQPSKIQEVSLPLILRSPPQNLIAQAQSGTGKTAAFVLGMLSNVDPQVEYPQALCVCHARELARQNYEVVKALAKETTIKPLLVVPEAPLPRQIKNQIIIGTPGRLIDVINRRMLEVSRIKMFVLDEADIMLDTQGLVPQTLRLKSLLPGGGSKCQILLFSATYTNEVIRFAKQVVHEPYVTIRLKRKEVSLDAITQYSIDCESEENKFNVLSELYAFLSIGQSIIFLNRKNAAIELTRRMQAAGHAVSLLHGDLLPTERDLITKEFREGRTNVLITTNVLARGIDIPTVTLVINYDLPEVGGKPDPQTYIHRIGRSGRFGRPGIAINFLSDEKSRNLLSSIEEYYRRKVQPLRRSDIPMLEAQLREIANP